jgi:hypothetical protein
VTLVELLNLNGNRFYHRTRATVRYLEKRWVECGRPTDHDKLEHFLDEALNFCVDTGLLYPSAILKRLKQMQRGEWTPPRAAA